MTNFREQQVGEHQPSTGKTGAELQNRREGRQNSVHGHQRSILLQSDRFLECGLPNASTMAADTEWPATSTSLNEPAK
jgi:hypothetical protein